MKKQKRLWGIIGAVCAVCITGIGSIALLCFSGGREHQEWREIKEIERLRNAYVFQDCPEVLALPERTEEQIAHYAELKKRYYPKFMPTGVEVNFFEDPKLPSLEGICGNREICAVVTVTEGYERMPQRELCSAYQEQFGDPGAEVLSQEQVLRLLEAEPGLMWRLEYERELFEVDVEEYLYDRTGCYLDHLTIQPASKFLGGYGHIPAYQGLRMVVFLQVEAFDYCSTDLAWSYILTEDGCVVPMTEEFGNYKEDYQELRQRVEEAETSGNGQTGGSGQEENGRTRQAEDYREMVEFGGCRLAEYAEAVKLANRNWEKREKRDQAIYDYLNQRLVPEVVKFNGSKISSAWRLLMEKKGKKREAYRLVAVVEDIWVDEILQKTRCAGMLELEWDGEGYTIIDDTLEWDIEEPEQLSEENRAWIIGLGSSWEDVISGLEWEATSGLSSWEGKQREEKRYEEMREKAEE